MATVRLHCPHCHRVDRLSVSEILELEPVGSRAAWLDDVAFGQFSYDGVAGLKCHLCGGWSVGVFSVDGRSGIELLKEGLSSGKTIETSGTVELLASYPFSKTVSVDESIPDEAATFFIEAKEDFIAGRSPAGIISKCRSVLDLCLKTLEAAGAGRKIRIADLRQKGLLTEGLAEWADKLWDDGNDAIHDLKGDRGRAGEHVTFLELFFDVAFVLPAQVEAARST